jgi:hypothetical protein
MKRCKQAVQSKETNSTVKNFTTIKDGRPNIIAMIKGETKSKSLPCSHGKKAGGTVETNNFYSILLSPTGNKDQTPQQENRTNSIYRKIDHKSIAINHYNRDTKSKEEEVIVKMANEASISTFDGSFMSGPGKCKRGDIVLLVGANISASGPCRKSPMLDEFGGAITKENEYLAGYGGQETVWRPSGFLNADKIVKLYDESANLHTRHSCILNSIGVNTSPILIDESCPDRYFISNRVYVLSAGFEQDPHLGPSVSTSMMPTICYEKEGDTNTWYTNKSEERVNCINYVTMLHQNYEKVEEEGVRKGHVICLKYPLYDRSIGAIGISRTSIMEDILHWNVIPHTVMFSLNTKKMENVNLNSGKSTLKDIHPLPTTKEEIEEDEKHPMKEDMVAIAYVSFYYPYLSLYLRTLKRVHIPISMARKLLNVRDGRIDNKPREVEVGTCVNTLNEDPKREVINLSEYTCDFEALFPEKDYEFFILSGADPETFSGVYPCKDITEDQVDMVIKNMKLGDKSAQVYAIKRSFKNVIERYNEDKKVREEIVKSCQGNKVEIEEVVEAVQDETASISEPGPVEQAGGMDSSTDDGWLSKKRGREQEDMKEEKKARFEDEKESSDSEGYY